MSTSDRPSHGHLARAGLALLLLSRAATGQGIPTPGIPNCLERCELTDPQLLRVARSTCALIAKNQMFPNQDRTYTIVTADSTSAFGLCPDSPWAGQPSFVAGRTGCLVGTDLVLTAAHGVLPTDAAFCADGWYFVFDYAFTSDAKDCNPPSGIVSADLVYECAEIVRHGAYNGDVDMLLIRLDRPVRDRLPVPVRRTGAPMPGDPIACVHHPDRLPAKIDTAASFVEFVPTDGIPQVLVTGIHADDGTSGAPIFNLLDGVIESVVIGGTCLSEDTSGGCKRLGTDCGQGLFPGTFGDSIVDFARHVDPYEFTILSQATVEHEGPAGGPLSNPVTTYRISAPPRAPGPIGIRSDVVVNRYGDYPGTVTAELRMPNLEKRAFLYPGESADLIVRVDQGKMPAGVGSVMVAVTNGANQNVDVLLHEFRVGVTGFQTLATTALPPIVEPAPPFQRSQVVTLTNVEANPVDVRVSAHADWITIDGTSGGKGNGGMATKTFHLNPAGQPGDRLDFPIGARHTSSVVYPGENTSTIDLINLDTGPFAYGEFHPQVVLDTRFGNYDVGTFVPVPDGNPRGVVIDVPVPNGFCIADLDVLMFVGTTHAEEIEIDLRAPWGTSLRLWDRNPSDEISTLFDDEGTPPPTGALLSTFDGHSAAGVWTMTIRDVVPGNPTFLNVSRLQFQSAGLCP